ncbi:MAG: hypothetical protein LBG30_02080 [Odoribacteraceae bacterium]|jgi:hypothetical protein|nr:hypothetical protein [Odoribacteraceae bacterium]
MGWFTQSKLERLQKEEERLTERISRLKRKGWDSGDYGYIHSFPTQAMKEEYEELCSQRDTLWHEIYAEEKRIRHEER